MTARRTFPKGGAGWNPDRAKRPAGDERTVSCSVVVRKGLQRSAVPARGAVRRSGGLRRSAGNGSESFQTQRVRRYGRPARVVGRSALVGGGRKPSFGHVLPVGMQKCGSSEEGRSTRAGLHRNGGETDLPDGESQPYRRSLENRRRKPHDWVPPLAGSRENGRRPT